MSANRILLSTIVLGALLHTSTTSAMHFSWNGTWSGTSERGNKIVVTIHKGRILNWTLNGEPRIIADASVQLNHVSLQKAGGGEATITAVDDDSLLFEWENADISSETVLEKQ